MVKHVVMWKMSADSAESHAKEMKRQLETLVGQVPGMISLEAGLNGNADEASADFVLITSHTSWEALHSYHTHPEHLKVAAYIRSVVQARWAVDFETL